MPRTFRPRSRRISPHLPERARFHVGMFRREIAHSVEGLMDEIHFFYKTSNSILFLFLREL